MCHRGHHWSRGVAGDGLKQPPGKRSGAHSAVANHFAFVAVFLGDEGKAQEGNGLKFSASGSAIVHRPFPFPEADVAN